MKILHTSDWHVGKVLKGRDRHDEHAAVLGSIVRTARDEDVDVVLVAGRPVRDRGAQRQGAGPGHADPARAARGRPPGRGDRRQPRQPEPARCGVPAGARRAGAARAGPAETARTRAAP